MRFRLSIDLPLPAAAAAGILSSGGDVVAQDDSFAPRATAIAGKFLLVVHGAAEIRGLSRYLYHTKNPLLQLYQGIQSY